MSTPKKMTEEQTQAAESLDALCTELTRGLAALQGTYPGLGYLLVLTKDVTDGSYMSATGTNMKQEGAVGILGDVANALRGQAH